MDDQYNQMNQNINNNLLENATFKLNPKDSVAVQNLKKTWYFASPDKLFNQCINLIVKNIKVILVEKPSNHIITNDCVTSKTSRENRKTLSTY